MAKRETLARARDQFLESGLPQHDVREEIAASWKRSALGGARPGGCLDIPVLDGMDHDTVFGRAARPVVRQLAMRLHGTATSVLLSDAAGRIIDRRSGTRHIEAALELVHGVPGALLSEEVAGTNGIGTAIERRQPTVVCGGEHFAAMFDGLACAGAPVFHPLTGRFEGVIDVSCPVQEMNAPLLPLALGAAEDIARELLATTTTGERALLDAHARTVRRSTSRMVVTVGGSLLLCNPPAARLLEDSDRGWLWDMAANGSVVLRGGGEQGCCRSGAGVSIWLQSGPALVRRLTPVYDGGDRIGATMELDPDVETGRQRSVQVAGLPGLVGTSPAWATLCGQVRAVQHVARPVAVLGGPGAGKLEVANALQALRGLSSVPLLDAATVALDGPTVFLAGVRRQLATAAGLVLRHVDLLPDDVAAAVATQLDSADPTSAVVVTGCERWPTDGPRALVDRVPHRIVVPSLSHRRGDLAELAAHLSRRHGATVRWPVSTVEALGRAALPGNVRELDAIVQQILCRVRVGDVDVSHLPAEGAGGSGRCLSRMELVERDAIVAALAEAGGNRHHAACELGIARATLYRKLAAYGIGLSS